MTDNNSGSIDNIPKSTPVYVILCDLDLRECLDAPKVLLAVKEFEQWMAHMSDVGEPREKRAIAEQFRDKLFACFADNDVRVPGWE